ncbi:cell division protein FtsZ, partial [Candidatus Parcubacteria bacterium]|nr:cell division protein FtsZ [Candidatus Parcubacteria bacterium]
IGQGVTQGLGAGMDASLGKRAAEENTKEISELLKEADMVFVTSGFGGGTGSGAGPVVASIAKNLGILTVAVVTTPFSFEGQQRKKIASQALADLKGHYDSLLVISNDNLVKIIDEKTTVSSAFLMCDDILRQAVESITDLMLAPGIINIDFASVISIMKDSGQALFGTGKASGPNRAVDAASKAIDSPVLDFSLKGSKGVLFNVSGSDVTLHEIQAVSEVITHNVDKRAKIVFGATKDPSLKKGEIKVTVIATKF